MDSHLASFRSETKQQQRRAIHSYDRLVGFSSSNPILGADELAERFRPRPHVVSGWIWKRKVFFAGLPSVHTYPMNTNTENANFRRLSTKWKLFKTQTQRIRVDGENGTSGNTDVTAAVPRTWRQTDGYVWTRPQFISLGPLASPAACLDIYLGFFMSKRNTWGWS